MPSKPQWMEAAIAKGCKQYAARARPARVRPAPTQDNAAQRLDADDLKRLNEMVRAAKRLRKNPQLSACATPRCYAYTRVSSREQAEEGFSLKVQAERCRAEFERLRKLPVGHEDHIGPGVEWAGLLVDDGISAFKKPILDRKVGRQLMSLNPGDHLIITRINRAFRSLRDSVNFQENICRPKLVRVHQVDNPGANYDTAMGKLNWQIVSAVAEMESNWKSEYLKELIESRRANGEAIPGNAPLGMKHATKGKRRVYVPDEAKLREMAWIVTFRQQGSSWPEVALRMAIRQAARKGVPPERREKVAKDIFNFRRYWGEFRCRKGWDIFFQRCAECSVDPATADAWRVFGVDRNGQADPPPADRTTDHPAQGIPTP